MIFLFNWNVFIVSFIASGRAGRFFRSTCGKAMYMTHTEMQSQPKSCTLKGSIVRGLQKSIVAEMKFMCFTVDLM